MAVPLIEPLIISMRACGTLQTFCKKCNRLETFKIIDQQGSHTYMCGCGCTIYRFHMADEFHRKSYFVKSFVPSTEFDPEYKSKNEFEKAGFQKKHVNGKTVYER